jgi:hypothetical protein
MTGEHGHDGTHDDVDQSQDCHPSYSMRTLVICERGVDDSIDEDWSTQSAHNAADGVGTPIT